MTLRQWDVHYFFNPYTKPAPKNKFIVVAYVDQAGWFYGLYVNSRVARFVQSQPALLPCMAELLQQAHSFLSYDSVVDCTTANVYQASEVSAKTYRGSLDAHAIIDVKTSVHACPKLLPIVKRRIAL